MGHGGKREKAGRKPKAEEIELIELLSPMDELALDAMQEGLEKKDTQILKLFMEYRYGKPKEKHDHNHSGHIGIVWQEIKNYGADDKTDESL